jgi:gluconokinase
MVIVLMGVSGSGKTTVGRLLAAGLGWPFADADDFHPPANVEKMRAGVPLTDADRGPWLAALRDRVDAAAAAGENLVLACSDLKHAYQEYLEHDFPRDVRYVYLHGSEELIRERLAARTGHFMNPALLGSQFEALEPPADAARVEINAPPAAVAADVRRRLGV